MHIQLPAPMTQRNRYMFQIHRQMNRLKAALLNMKYEVFCINCLMLLYIQIHILVHNNAFLTFFANFLIVRKQKKNHQWNFHFSYETGYILCANFICSMNNSSGFKSVLQSCHVPFLTNALLHLVINTYSCTQNWHNNALVKNGTDVQELVALESSEVVPKQTHDLLFRL